MTTASGSGAPGAHAAAIVLQYCATTGRSYWAWTDADWADLCGGSAEAFVAAQTLPTETTVRPFLVALAYLLGGFDDFQQLGTFNRLHLAGLVFGAAAVEESLHEAGAVLHRSGYRSVLSGKHHLRGVFSQALLINRSPRLVDEVAELAWVHRVRPGAQGQVVQLHIASRPREFDGPELGADRDVRIDRHVVCSPMCSGAR